MDKTVSDKEKRVFEGASIQLYLAAKYDKDYKISFPYDSDEYWEMVEWMIWMQSGIGPMQGQANHFYRYAPEKIDYAINRYQTETKRLYQVLNDRLASQEAAGQVRASQNTHIHPPTHTYLQGNWLVGGKYTIADLCSFVWVNWAEWAGVETKPFPALQKWLETIQKRPAVEKGNNIPDKFEMKEAMKTKEGAEEYAKHHSNWVMKGMGDDGEKYK